VSRCFRKLARHFPVRAVVIALQLELRAGGERMGETAKQVAAGLIDIGPVR
jgi:hypothetical protein